MVIPRFQLTGICKYYPQRLQWGAKTTITALQNLNITLYDGQIQLLLGPSGSGKTTLAKLLMRLEKPDKGQILYKHTPIQHINKKFLWTNNQMLFQSPTLSMNPALTIYKILAEPLLIANQNTITTKKTETTLTALLELLELPNYYLKAYPGQLSGGERQRIALARALLLKPEFLILDEPLAALDELTAQNLCRIFLHVFQYYHIGVLWITHTLDPFYPIASTVFTLNK